MKTGEKRLLVFVSLLLSLAILAAIWLFRIKASEPTELILHFLNVGQGDAIYARLPDGQDVLIDGGPGRRVLAELAAVMPWWDRHLDLVVLTHPHDDHVGGLASVAERFRIGRVWSGEEQGLSPLARAWEETLSSRSVSRSYFDQVSEYSFGQNCTLKRLSGGPAPERTGLNELSAILRLDCASTSVLLMADAGQAEEEGLIAAEADVDADILKVGHHGSGHSSSRDFLSAVSPELAVIQVGVGNSYGHPSPAVLKRLERIASSTHRTDLSGRLSLRLSNGHWEAIRPLLDFERFSAILSGAFR